MLLEDSSQEIELTDRKMKMQQGFFAIFLSTKPQSQSFQTMLFKLPICNSLYLKDPDRTHESKQDAQNNTCNLRAILIQLHGETKHEKADGFLVHKLSNT